jgi:DNA-binding HxlR family transcriptional regulator
MKEQKAIHPETVTDLVLSCQVADALKILGDRWSFLILRDIFLGNHRFEQFRSRIGIARGTLTSRLKSLVETGILYKKPYQTLPTRYEYRLTDKGIAIYPQALMAWQWEHDWATDQEGYIPIKLVHKNCGHIMQPELQCSHCKEVISIHDVDFKPGPGVYLAEPLSPRFQRRTKPKSKYPEGVDTKLFHIVDVIGDRWSGLIVAALFFGLRRFDEIGSAIGIATNILTDRLKLLIDTGIVVHKVYQKKPTRYEYRLTDKGRDLYGQVLMMHQWSDEWLMDNRASPLLLTHIPCGKPLYGIVVCSVCSEELTKGSIDFQFG